MLNLLSCLTDNFPKGFHKEKCKDCKSHYEYITVNENYKNYLKMMDHGDINKFLPDVVERCLSI